MRVCVYVVVVVVGGGGVIEGTSYRQEVGGCRLPQRQYFPHPPLTTNKRKTEIKSLPSENNQNSREKRKNEAKTSFEPSLLAISSMHITAVSMFS